MSDDLSVRAQLAAVLKPLLPSAWRILDHQRMPKNLDGITLVIKHLEMERLAEAPMGSLRHQIVLLVADPHEDQDAAEDALDDSVLELCTVLDSLPELTWTGARKTFAQPDLPYLGWDITLTVITKKKEPSHG